MSASDYLMRPATEQAAAIRAGELTSRELVEESLHAIEALNRELNAFVTMAAERALAEADAIEPGDDRPLAGVPIGIKDLIALTEGIRTTHGMSAMGDWVPDHDSATVRKLRKDGGAIVVGKTNTPELGIPPVTEPVRFGPTRNPWDTSRTPGGSSGGSAAAVGAGMVPLAHGNDGGGSIRIPASCCGLFGLKPTRGRVSWAPDWTEGAIGLPTDGVLTRTVMDSAVALDLLAGYEPGDSFLVPPPSAPFARAVEREPGKLRIGFTVDAPNGVPVDPECQQAVKDAVQLLEGLGHQIEEAVLPADEALTENFVKVWVGATGEELHTFERWLGAPLDRSQIEPMTAQMEEIANAQSGTELLIAMDYLRRMSRQILAFWIDRDVLVTPTLAKPPIEIGALDPAEGEPPIQRLVSAATFAPFTPMINVTGQPAMSVPLHQSEAGLPVGAQFVGPPAGEEMLLSLAAQLEQASPWAGRRPPLHASAATA
jgi:amidase